MKLHRALLTTVLVAQVGTVGCSNSASADSAGGAPGPSGGGTSAGTGGATSSGGPSGEGGTSAGSDGGAVLPPETEQESSFEVPIATGRFVWIANPTSGRVAYVDATTLDVHTVEAGNAPTFLAAIPSANGDDAVIVLNVLSDDATVLRAQGATLSSQTIKGLAHGANTWAVSANGQWAIAWTDATRVAQATSTQGFQDISILNLATTDATKMKTVVAVGYRPAVVAFAADGTRAFAVTEDGISIVDLAAASGPTVARNIALTADPTVDADTRDVSITPDGRLAIIRREGSSALGIVDLTSGALTSLDLGGAITDVDLTDSGDRAVAVVRDLSAVMIVPLTAGAPTLDAVTRIDIPGETIGSVVLASGGKMAVLYSNATIAERLTVLSLDATPAYHVVKLHGPVLSAFPTPDGQNAVVIHRAVPPTPTGVDAGTSADGGAHADAGAALPPPEPVAAAAFSLVPLTGNLPALLQDTGTPPTAVAIAPTSNRALVTVLDTAHQTYGVYLGSFPSLAVTLFPLASPPISVGVVAGASRGFVAQQHPEGRITFVGLDSGDARTLTGFELGARVVDWSQP